jgi:hypothetical protein
MMVPATATAKPTPIRSTSSSSFSNRIAQLKIAATSSRMQIA